MNDMSCDQHIIGNMVRLDICPGLPIRAERVLAPAGADEDSATAGGRTGQDVRRAASSACSRRKEASTCSTVISPCPMCVWLVTTMVR